MALALGHHGLPVPREFPKKFAALQEALTGWLPHTWTGVVQLHDARNQAQHQGTLADPSFVPRWVADADQFVRSLVAAAFSAELRDILLAGAVASGDIRECLLHAERSLAQGDTLDGFNATVRGFDLARAQWRGQRADAIGHLTVYASGFGIDDPQHDPVNRALERIEDLAEVQPFAPDIAEYLWLTVRRGEHESDVAVNAEDAFRAFQFVVAWVLRWEAFVHRYRERRYPPPPPEYQSPVTGAAGPVIWDCRVETQQNVGDIYSGAVIENVRFTIRISLADVPGLQAETWADEVTSALNEVLNAEANGRVYGAQADRAGIVRFFGVTHEANGEEIAEWLRRSVLVGGQRYIDRLARERAVDGRLEALRDQLADRIGEHPGVGDIVSGVETRRQGDLAQFGIRLLPWKDDPFFHHLLHEVVGRLRGLYEIADYDGTMVWFTESAGLDAAVEFAVSVATEYNLLASERRAGLAAVARRRLALEIELRMNAVRPSSET